MENIEKSMIYTDEDDEEYYSAVDELMDNDGGYEKNAVSQSIDFDKKREMVVREEEEEMESKNAEPLSAGQINELLKKMTGLSQMIGIIEIIERERAETKRERVEMGERLDRMEIKIKDIEKKIMCDRNQSTTEDCHWKEMEEGLKQNEDQLQQEKISQRKEVEILRKDRAETIRKEEKGSGREGNKKLEELKLKFEMEARRRRRNNIVITGLRVNNKNDLLNWFQENLKMRINIKNWWEIKAGHDKLGVELESSEIKEEIMNKKYTLRGSDVFIDNDLTWEERKIRYRYLVERVEKEEEKRR